MGLVLTLREGDSFFVGEQRYVIEQVFDPTHFIVLDPDTDTRHEVTDERLAEIGPEVLVCASQCRQQVNISIEAPREVPVRREKVPVERRGGRR